MLNITINNVLQKLTERIERNKDYLQTTQGTQFEKIIDDLLQIISENQTHFLFYHNGEHSFPDFSIIIDEKRYGLEVKYSNSGSWVTNGNSVFETISHKGNDIEDNYHEIYIIYGRKPKKRENLNQLEVKYDKYENAVSDITVTHSPRYRLQMRNENEESVFSLIDLPYKEFRLLSVEEKNHLIRDYFKQKQSEQDKWYMPLSLEVDSESVQPQLFEDLAFEQRELLLAEVLILYWEDLFANHRSNYKRIVSYLVSKYFVVSASLRDKFSASGKINIDGLDLDLQYPQILKTYQDKLPLIKQLIEDPDDEFELLCYSIWEESSLDVSEIDDNLSLKDNYLNILESFRFVVKIRTGNGAEIDSEPKPYLSILFRNYIDN